MYYKNNNNGNNGTTASFEGDGGRLAKSNNNNSNGFHPKNTSPGRSDNRNNNAYAFVQQQQQQQQQEMFASYKQREILTSMSMSSNSNTHNTHNNYHPRLLFTQLFPLECNNSDYIRQIVDICCHCLVTTTNTAAAVTMNNNNSHSSKSSQEYVPLYSVDTLELLNELSGYSVFGSFAGSPQRVGVEQQGQGQSLGLVAAAAVTEGAGTPILYSVQYPTLYCREGCEETLQQCTAQLLGFLDEFRYFILHGHFSTQAQTQQTVGPETETETETGSSSMPVPVPFHDQLAKTSCLSRLTLVFDTALCFLSCLELPYDPYAGPVEPSLEPLIKHQLELLALQRQCWYHRDSKQQRLQEYALKYGACNSDDGDGSWLVTKVDKVTAAELFDGGSSGAWEEQGNSYQQEHQHQHQQVQEQEQKDQPQSMLDNNSTGGDSSGSQYNSPSRSRQQQRPQSSSSNSPLRVTDFSDGNRSSNHNNNNSSLNTANNNNNNNNMSVGSFGSVVLHAGPPVSCNYTPKKHSTLHSTATSSHHVYKYNLKQESLLQTVNYILQYMRMYAPTATYNSNTSTEVAYSMLLFRLAAITTDLNHYIHYHATDTFNYTEAHRLHALNQIVDRTIHVSLLNDTSTDSIPVLTLTAAGTTPTEEEAAAEEAISIAPIQTMGNRDYPSLNIDPSVPLPALVYGKQRLHTVFELIRIAKNLLVNLLHAESEANKKSNFAVAATLLNSHRELHLTCTNLEQLTSTFAFRTDPKIIQRVLNHGGEHAREDVSTGSVGIGGDSRKGVSTNSNSSSTSFIDSDFLFKYIYKSTDAHSIAGLIIKASAKRTLQFIQRNWPGITIFNRTSGHYGHTHHHTHVTTTNNNSSSSANKKKNSASDGGGVSDNDNRNNSSSKDIQVVNVGLGYGHSTSGRMGKEHRHIITEPVSFESWDTDAEGTGARGDISGGGDQSYIPPLPSHHVAKPAWNSQGGRITHNNSMNTMNANDVCGHSFEDTLTASFRRTLSSTGVNNVSTSSTTQRTRIKNVSLYSKPTVVTELKNADLVVLPTHSSQSLRIRSMAPGNTNSTAGTTTANMGRPVNTIINHNNSTDTTGNGNSNGVVNVQKLLYDWNNANTGGGDGGCHYGSNSSVNSSASASRSMASSSNNRNRKPTPTTSTLYNSDGSSSATRLTNSLQVSNSILGIPRSNYSSPRPYIHSYYNTAVEQRVLHPDSFNAVLNSPAIQDNYASHGIPQQQRTNRNNYSGSSSSHSIANSSSVLSPSRSGTFRANGTRDSSGYGGYVDAQSGRFIATGPQAMHLVESNSISNRDTLYQALITYCSPGAVAHTKLLHRLHCLVQDLLHIRDHYCSNSHPNQDVNAPVEMSSPGGIYSEDDAYSHEFHRIDHLVHVLLETINADCVPVDGSGGSSCNSGSGNTGIAAVTNVADSDNADQSLLYPADLYPLAGDSSSVLFGYSRLEDVAEVIHQSGAYMHQLGARIQQANTQRNYMLMKTLKDTLHDYTSALDKLKACVQDVSILDDYDCQNMIHSYGTSVLTSDFLFQFHSMGLYKDTQNIASLSILCGNSRILWHIRRYWPDFSVLSPLSAAADDINNNDQQQHPQERNDENEEQVCFTNIPQLCRLGFTLSMLESAGVESSDLLAAGFSIAELRDHGFNINHLRNSTCLSDQTLRNLALEAKRTGAGGNNDEGEEDDYGVDGTMLTKTTNSNNINTTSVATVDTQPISLLEMEMLLYFYSTATNGDGSNSYNNNSNTNNSRNSNQSSSSPVRPNSTFGGIVSTRKRAGGAFSGTNASNKNAGVDSTSTNMTDAANANTGGVWTNRALWEDLKQQYITLTQNPGTASSIVTTAASASALLSPGTVTTGGTSSHSHGHGQCIARKVSRLGRNDPPFGITYSVIEMTDGEDTAGGGGDGGDEGDMYSTIGVRSRAVGDIGSSSSSSVVSRHTSYSNYNNLNNSSGGGGTAVSRFDHPNAAGRYRSVTRIVLPNNNICGQLPESISVLGNLQHMILNNNALEGSLPVALGNLPSLTTLYLHYNRFTGQIPRSLGHHCSQLLILRLENNQLTGTIPESLCQCVHLKRIVLSHNQLTGSIPSRIGQLHTLQELILSHNQLSGSIPPSLSNCSMLTTCMLDHNAFSGVITESIAHLKYLTALHIQNNDGAALHVDKLTLQRWLPKCHIKL